MRKSILGLVIGMLIGAAIVAIPAYAAVKQYILTEYTQPVLIDGVRYSDKDNPVLNYNGRTYVPLAKLGDMTGLQYHYNNEKKQVEIQRSSNVTTPSPIGGSGLPDTVIVKETNGTGIAGREGDILQPNSVIEEPEEPGYKGYIDTEDPSYQMAVALRRAADDFPPLMSEGWISQGMLSEIENIYIPINSNPLELEFVKSSFPRETLLATLKVTADFIAASSGDFEFNGIHIKKYYGNIFFSIEDLIKQGIVE